MTSYFSLNPNRNSQLLSTHLTENQYFIIVQPHIFSRGPGETTHSPIVPQVFFITYFSLNPIRTRYPLAILN